MKKHILLLFAAAALYGFESTNIQWPYSADFNGDTYVYDTNDGKKATLTFEHFRTWTLGDLFMFVDIVDGMKSDEHAV